MSSAKEQEADKLMKKAQKEISPSLLDFRLKPDWEQAAPSLERAALLYKQSKCLDKALAALEQAATAQERLGSLWHAGKHYEACAELCKEMGQVERVPVFYQRAADAYCSSGKVSAGADALARGARAVESDDIEQSVKMLLEALELYENDGKEALGADTYRLTIATMIKAKKFGQAAEQLMRFAFACSKIGSHNSQCKAYLGAVVVHLHNMDGTAAWHAFQDAMDVEVFANSDEAFLADALFQAYKSGDADAVRKVVEKQGFKQLENQVARLAVKLPVKFSTVSKDVAQAMGVDHDGDEGPGEENSEDEVR